MPLSFSLATAIAIGVATGVFGDPWLQQLFAPWVIALLTLAMATAAARRHYQLAVVAGHIGLTAVALVVAGTAHQRALHPPLRTLLDQRIGGFAIGDQTAAGAVGPITIEGRLRDDAAPSHTSVSLALDVERVWLGVCPEAVSGGVLVSVSGSLASSASQEWRAGRRVRFPATLRRPARYLNHGVPDYERVLARRGVSLVGGVKSAALVEVIEKGGPADEAASAARTAVRRAVARHISSHDRQSGAVADAILIGDRAALDPVVERRLQEAGTYHVIAISGGNIAILAGAILVVLWWSGIRGAWAAGVTIPLLAGYAFVSGGGASVVRATSMAAIYLALRLIDQRTAPAHAMALTVAAVLLATPLSIADVGFWLTFGATAAIVAATRLTFPTLSMRMPAGLIVASVAAEAALMPIGAMVFHRVTLAGPLLNLAAIPCMAIVQLAAMLTVSADALGVASLARAAGWVAHAASRVLIDSASLVDFAPWITWQVVPPPLVLVVAYYVSMVTWWQVSGGLLDTRMRQMLRRVSLATTVVLFIWIAIAPPALARQHGDGRLRLTMLDVGQGDATVVRVPNGRTLMVDTGGVSSRGGFDLGDRVLGPALRALGLTRLDYLAITHGDPDHIGGAVALVTAFSPIEIWEGVPIANHEAAMHLHSAGATARTSLRQVQRGDRFEVGGVEIRVHHPPLADWERQRVRNDDSIVLELRYGRVSLLLTGDIGRDIEHALIPTLDLLPIVILKSPHHGSATSSSAEFLDAIKPDVVLISCGRGNTYGHPVPHVLERYHAVGAEIFRTDQEGQIDLVTDGESLDVRTFTGRRLGMR